MTKWKKEIELIDNFGLLYPTLGLLYPTYSQKWTKQGKAYWICDLCVFYLNQRIPQLEEFIKRYAYYRYNECYTDYFKIK